jgi:small subunit ribosomal protein S20
MEVQKLAHHKSAIKRHKQSLVKNERNRTAKSALRTVMKKFNAALVKGPAEAKEIFSEALHVISKTASRGIIHKKNASRKISRISKKLHKAVSAT